MYGYEILHEGIVDGLINNVRKKTAAHAYIFEGAEGVGNVEAAKLFANALVCEREENTPCGLCNACIMARADTHPDIAFIKPPEGKKNILVDTVREAVKDAYTKPYEHKKKVYIISYGDDMNEQAQNALLKVLEEPPEYAVFIILAKNSESLLITIRSRCTLVHFPPVSTNKIKEYVKKKFPEHASDAEFYARLSSGIAHNADKILKDENFIPVRESAFERMEKLFSQSLKDAYDIADYLEENKESAEEILEFWLSFIRDMILVNSGMQEKLSNIDMKDRLIRLANIVPEKKAVDAIEAVMLAQKMKKRYVSLHTLSLKLAFSIKSAK